MSAFIHLRNHSSYSLLEGAMKVKDLVSLAAKEKMPAIALTDSGNLFGALKFSLTAKQKGVQPIIGCQMGVLFESGEKAIADPLVLLVQNETGYKNLIRIVTQSFLDTEVAAPSVHFSCLQEHCEGLICLTGGAKGPLGRLLLARQEKAADALLQQLKTCFGDRLYIELQRHGLREEEQIEEKLLDFAYDHDIAIVATNENFFAEPEMYEAHDALLCVAGGRYVIEEDRRRVTPEHYFKSAAEMQRLFEDLPEAIANTAVIAQRCSYALKSSKPMLPRIKMPDGQTEDDALRIQSTEGLEKRLENYIFKSGMTEEERIQAARPYRERLEYELGIISQTGFSGYFLIVADFIQWAKAQGIPVGPGRGSGVASVVAWSITITDINPLQFNLVFERLLNLERITMPDFDVDFCQERRDEVIDYVRRKYGHDHVAQIITFGELKARAVLRDVGRVLQMPYGQVDRLCKMIPNNPANPVTLGQAIEGEPLLQQARREDDNVDRLLTFGLMLEGLYRHASTHAAGLVIGDRPLVERIPLYRDPKSDGLVTQFDMKDVETAGLVKFDFLGLKTLTVLQRAVQLLAQRDIEIDLGHLPFDDEKTFQMLSRGEATGVFQLESSGMRDTLKRMKPDRFEDLIALLSLYRPGPMDNIPKYIAVKNGDEEADYLYPSLEPVLKETYGIIIYQEQVMQVAQVLSGYTLGGADQLRRAMGKKIKEEMDAQRKIFVDGAVARGVDAGRAEFIFEHVAKFAGYGFNKAHATAYALISWQTAYLKANYPVEFMAALMTLDAGNTDKLAQFRQELDRLQIRLLPADVNASGVVFNVETLPDGQLAVRYALAALKGVGEAAMQYAVTEREQNGLYRDFMDFVVRNAASGFNKKQLESLIAAGAFDALHGNRAALMALADSALRYAQNRRAEQISSQGSLFTDQTMVPPPPVPDVAPWLPFEKLQREFDAIGFYLSAHPLDDYQKALKRLGVTRFADLADSLVHRVSSRIKMAGVVTGMTIKTIAKTGNKMAFVQLSDNSGTFEVTLFSEVLTEHRDKLVEGQTIIMTVEAQMNEENLRLTGHSVQDLNEAASHIHEGIVVTLQQESAVADVQKLIANARPGRSEIMIRVLMDAYNSADIALPSMIVCDPALRHQLAHTRGVLSVEDL